MPGHASFTLSFIASSLRLFKYSVTAVATFTVCDLRPGEGYFVVGDDLDIREAWAIARQTFTFCVFAIYSMIDGREKKRIEILLFRK